MSRTTRAVRGLVRQGDVLLVPLDEIPYARQHVRDHNVVAEGEATGHAHVVVGPARLVQATPHTAVAGELFVVVHGRSATLRHEEHDPIELARGVYRVVRQREYEPPLRQGSAGWRRVAD
jgi:hypothetical protein